MTAVWNNRGFPRHGFLLALRYLSASSHCVISPFVAIPDEQRTFEDADGQRQGGWWRGVFVEKLSSGNPSSCGWSAKIAQGEFGGASGSNNAVDQHVYNF